MGTSSSALWIVVAVVVLGGVIKVAFAKPSRMLASRFKRIDLFNSTEHSFFLRCVVKRRHISSCWRRFEWAIS
jgi:hypothetical protein